MIILTHIWLILILKRNQYKVVPMSSEKILPKYQETDFNDSQYLGGVKRLGYNPQYIIYFLATVAAVCSGVMIKTCDTEYHPLICLAFGLSISHFVAQSGNWLFMAVVCAVSNTLTCLLSVVAYIIVCHTSVEDYNLALIITILSCQFLIFPLEIVSLQHKVFDARK